MALPPRVKAMLKTHSHTSHQRHIGRVRSNIANSSNIVRHVAAKQLDEIGPVEARAVDKILALP
ncbi:MAG TPA: hypothetical protein VMX74_09075 [Pirellulales bacterium]|nr:hypothetical protein [Pirellulales bacterium]